MKIDVTAEIVFATARSGGKGGQNVNKVETMVEGRWNIAKSNLCNEEQKQILFEKLFSKITKDGCLLMKSQVARTQLSNKDLVIYKMNETVNTALKKKKIRIATKIPKALIEKRLQGKKIKAEIKENRKKIQPQ